MNEEHFIFPNMTDDEKVKYWWEYSQSMDYLKSLKEDEKKFSQNLVD